MVVFDETLSIPQEKILNFTESVERILKNDSQIDGYRIFTQSYEYLEVEVGKASFKPASHQACKAGIVLTIWKGQRCSSIASSIGKKPNELVAKAKKLISFATFEPDFSFKASGELSPFESLPVEYFDKNLLKLSLDDLISFVYEMGSVAKIDPTGESISNEMCLFRETVMLTGDYFDLKKYTIAGMSCQSFLALNRQPKIIGYSSSASRKQIQGRIVGSMALANAVMQTSRRAIHPSEVENINRGGCLIWSPQAWSDLLAYVLVPALKSHHFLPSSHILAKSVGKLMTDSRLSISDDPHIKNGLNSRPYDDFGFRLSSINLIKDGIFKGFLNDYLNPIRRRKFYAEYFKTQPRSYSYSSGVFPTNIQIRFEDIEKNIFAGKQGLYIKNILGAHGNSPLTGNFIIGINEGYLVKNGQVTEGISDCNISGNIYDLLRGIIAVGPEQANIQPFAAPFSVISPSVCTKDNSKVFL